MMSALFYWTGALLWALSALWLAVVTLVPLAQVTSYYAMCIIAAFRHDRWRIVKWRRLPADFFATWWKWFRYGRPDKITGPYATWQGVFKWYIAPRNR